MMIKLTLILYLGTYVSLTPLVHGRVGKVQLANNCSYTIWPASDKISTEFSLSKDESQHIDFPSMDSVFDQTSFKLWGRTDCKTNAAGKFTCKTGDCGSHRINCSGKIPLNNMPTTLVDFNIQNTEEELDYYDVSVVYGYNLPVMVAPPASGCQATGCIVDVDVACPPVLESNSTCASPCSVFNTSEYCCTSGECNPTTYSRIFKKACPHAYCYLTDDATSTFACQGSSYYVVTFCPSPQLMARLGLIGDIQTPSAPTGLRVKSKYHRQTYLLDSIPPATLFLVLLCLCFFIHRRKVRRRYLNAQFDEIKSVDSLQFDLNMIKAATHNFSKENKLGHGGFGEVYKGELENGQEIALKRLSKTSVQGVVEFKTEVVLVAKLQHKNLVKLLGFCAASEEKILVYEYLPNSSLDKFIFDSINSQTLEWQTRLKIIIGVARAILYLHEDSRLKVIHRDLKTSNILLDQDMNPKISDFGLAKLFRVDQTQGDTQRIVGTYGYMAPEYAITGHYSVKSDVYARNCERSKKQVSYSTAT